MAWELAESCWNWPHMGFQKKKQAFPLGLLGTTDNFFNELKYQRNNPPGSCYLFSNSQQRAACGICSVTVSVKGGARRVVTTWRHIYPTLLPRGLVSFAVTLQPSWLKCLGPGRNAALKADGWIWEPAQRCGVRRAGSNGGDVALQPVA